jgi:hypothetical protein
LYLTFSRSGENRIGGVEGVGRSRELLCGGDALGEDPEDAIEAAVRDALIAANIGPGSDRKIVAPGGFERRPRHLKVRGAPQSLRLVSDRIQ